MLTLLMWFGILITALIGAIYGSFLTTYSFRRKQRSFTRNWTEKFTILSAASFCPVCRKSIYRRDNIPIFSYLYLRQQCRFCSSRIPSFSFFLEVFGACAFSFSLQYTSWIESIIRILCISLLMLLITETFSEAQDF